MEYLDNLNKFDASIIALEKGIQNSVSVNKLRFLLSSARLQYKRIEHFITYFQPEAINRYINGAPLPKTEEANPDHTIIPSMGLQALDEVIFEEDPDLEEVDFLVQELIYYWRPIYQFERSRRFQHRYVFESCRYQILRIYTLGLTGFDTPGSVNAIPEAIVSLGELSKTISSYRQMFEGTTSLVRAIEEFKSYLNGHNDFENLDRLFILRNFVNPLYSGIYDLQSTLQIEMVDEVDPTLHAVNYDAKYLFSQDFLNKSYYAQIADSDLNDPKKIQLGKILFHDPILSKEVNMACVSCHDPTQAFTDGLKKSKSNTPGMTTDRNSPTLINAVYSDKYFYDLREYDLERQVKHVVMDSKEFNMDFIDLADRLKTSNEYVELFKDAYGDRDRYGISSWSISNALAAYVASLASWNSPFDQYARGELTTLPDNVIRGHNLFMGKAACGTCHFAPTFGGTVPVEYRESESEVLGVPAFPDTVDATLDEDPGRINSGKIRDELPHFAFSFKTTTVRNVALTAPYMHNGVYDSLEQVLDFYNRGGGAGIGIELEHQTLPDSPLNLTQSEQKDIIAFLESLTDTVGMTDQNVSLPAFGNEWDNRKQTY
jgi:cytochrome c peroxidase